jgi:hypothetical protein
MRVLLLGFMLVLASCGRNSPKLEYSNVADIGICTIDLRGELDLYEIAEDARFCQRKLTEICESKLTINESVFLEKTKDYASYSAHCYLVRKKVD